MATYIALINWTDQGIRNVKEAPKRLDAAKSTLKELGGEFKAIYLTMGEYDFVMVYEAPDDAVAARIALTLGSRGNVRTKTLKAFPEQDYRDIVSSLA